jgi:hypothetical protein
LRREAIRSCRNGGIVSVVGKHNQDGCLKVVRKP